MTPATPSRERLPFDATLSDDAKALAGCIFGWCPRLEFGTPSRITPRAKAALDELIAAEVIVVEEMPPAGVRYRPRVPVDRYVRWMKLHPAAGKYVLVDESDGLGNAVIEVLAPTTPSGGRP